MDATEIIFSAIIGLSIWSVILNSIISRSSKSKKIEQHLRIQNQLLAKIAQAQGVSIDEIKSVFTKNNYTI